MPKEVLEFIEQNSDIADDGGLRYYYMPRWIIRNPKTGVTEICMPDELLDLNVHESIISHVKYSIKRHYKEFFTYDKEHL